MFFCELVAAEKLKVENFDPMDFSFIDNAVGKWATEWAKFHPHSLIFLDYSVRFEILNTFLDPVCTTQAYSQIFYILQHDFPEGLPE